MDIALPPGARAVLLGPDMVARTLAAREPARRRRWRLRRPRGVRRAFLEDVIEDGAHEERWMLLADRETRESYVRDVLEAAKQPDRQAIWRRRQAEPVRRSYVEQVIDAR